MKYFAEVSEAEFILWSEMVEYRPYRETYDDVPYRWQRWIDSILPQPTMITIWTWTTQRIYEKQHAAYLRNGKVECFFDE